MIKYITQTGTPDMKMFFSFLDTIYTSPQKTLIAVSGGPDSMFVSYVMHQYRLYRMRDTNLLYYIYCDHQIRKEHNDINIITQRIQAQSLHIFQKPANISETEASLRIWRYQHYRQLAQLHSIHILVTGHNLSDRIESTFLHLMRGSGIQGFLNMRRVESNSELFPGIIVRPLLSVTKTQIKDWCDTLHIPYIIDYTNQDITVSKRNLIRHTILQQIKNISAKNKQGYTLFESSMQSIYDRCERHYAPLYISLVPIPRLKIWSSRWAYKRNISPQDISAENVYSVLKQLHSLHGVQRKTLQELVDFLRTKKKGYKYMYKIYWFICHKNIYIIKAPMFFWKKKIENTLTDWGKIFEPDNMPHTLPHKRTRATQDDRIHGKSIKKRCINHKIPLFWRENIILEIQPDGTKNPRIFPGMQ